MKITRHKGREADQSHNYTIDVTRGELKLIDQCLQTSLEFTPDNAGYDQIISMSKEIAKYIE